MRPYTYAALWCSIPSALGGACSEAAGVECNGNWFMLALGVVMALLAIAQELRR